MHPLNARWHRWQSCWHWCLTARRSWVRIPGQTGTVWFSGPFCVELCMFSPWLRGFLPGIPVSSHPKQVPGQVGPQWWRAHSQRLRTISPSDHVILLYINTLAASHFHRSYLQVARHFPGFWLLLFSPTIYYALLWYAHAIHQNKEQGL